MESKKNQPDDSPPHRGSHEIADAATTWCDGQTHFAQAVLDAAPVIVLLLTPQGEIQHVNPFFEKLTGWQLDEIKGKDWFSTCLPERDRDRIRALFKSAAKNDPTRSNINAIITTKGDEREIEWNDQVIMDAGGRIISLMAVGTDVTERRRTEDDLRKTRDRFDAMLQALPDLLFEVDQTGRILDYRASRADFLALPPEEFLGKPFTEVLPLEAAEVCLEAIREAATKNVGYGKPYRLELANGDHWFEPSVARMGPKGDDAQTFILLARDVTTRIRAIQEVRASEERHRQLVENSPYCIHELDREGQFISMNQAGLRMMEVTSAAFVIGRRYLDFVSESDRSRIAKLFQSALSGQLSEFTYTCQLGHVIRSNFVPLANGTIMGISLDVTEQLRTENALRERKARLNEAQRIARIGSWELDFSTKRLVWSDEIFRIFEVDPTRFGSSYEAFLDAVHPDDRELVHLTYNRSIETKQPYDVVHRLLMPDGRIKFVRECCETEYDSTDKPIRSVGTVQDVTERILAEQALRTSETRLREAHRIAGLGAWEYDFASQRLWWSEEQYALNGVESNAPITQSFFLSLIHPEDRSEFNKAFDLLISQGSVKTEYRIVRPDGAVRFLHGLASVTLDADGRPVRMHGTNQDITERNLAEMRRQEIDDRFRLVIEKISDGFFILDREWRYVEINSAGAAMVGFTPRQLIGRRYLDVFPEAAGTIWEMTYSRVLETGMAAIAEEFYRPLGKWFEARAYPFTEGISVFFSDVTKRKQAELEAQQFRDHLAHTNRLVTLGEIASGLAHELNQPLCALQLDADTAMNLGEDSASPDLRRCLRHISEQANRAGEIVRRMRSFIRRDSVNRAPYSIDRLIHEVLAMLGARLRQNSVTIELKLAERLPQIVVDAIQIQQVFVNLVRNAEDAMMMPNLDWPRVLAIESELIDDEVLVRITDSGCGIDPVFAEKLFYPFHTTKPKGLGLGLVICRAIVEAHGGRIDVRSNPVRGTTFTIALPALLPAPTTGDA